ncbi:MAG: DUF1893 domain-containing protein [Phycisphaerae bacterium]|nr:DUF1893 domain-containing protein [Phycisphaerae bacterium]
MQSSLEVFDHDGRLFYQCDGKWLEPLFQLIHHLSQNKTDISSFILKDKIIGVAAAVLIIQLGFKKCHGVLMSKKAVNLLEINQVDYSFDELVNEISCKTEKMITPDMNLQTAYIQLLALQKVK